MPYDTQNRAVPQVPQVPGLPFISLGVIYRDLNRKLGTCGTCGTGTCEGGKA